MEAGSWRCVSTIQSPHDVFFTDRLWLSNLLRVLHRHCGGHDWGFVYRVSSFFSIITVSEPSRTPAFRTYFRILHSVQLLLQLKPSLHALCSATWMLWWPSSFTYVTAVGWWQNQLRLGGKITLELQRKCCIGCVFSVLECFVSLSYHCVCRRGSMLSTAIFVYAATSPVNGYFGGSLYAKQGGKQSVCLFVFYL